jgi:glutathione S-transferase
MKLYSGPLSLFTGKVRIALDEKGIAYELVSVPFSRVNGYQPKHPDVLAANPKGQVPVLVDGDLTVFDSTIILEYLEDRYPTPALYPADAAERARCRQLEAAADEILFPFVFELIQEVFYKASPAGRNEARIASARAGIAAHYDGLERNLGTRPYLCGGFSVADIGYFLTITFATGLGAPLGDAHQRLQAWYDRVRDRPAVTKEAMGLAAAMTAVGTPTAASA